MSKNQSLTPLLVLLAMTLSACTAGHRITRLDTKVQIPQGDQAAYYALPRTVVISTFSVQRTKTLTGIADGEPTDCISKLNEKASWLQKKSTLEPLPPLWKAIGLKNGKAEVGSVFKVFGTPSLGTAAEPDPAQVFRVELSSSATKKRELDLVYGPLGLLKEGTSIAADKRLDLALATFQTFVKTAGTFTTMAFLRTDRLPALSPEPELGLCQQTAKDIYEKRESVLNLRDEVNSGGLTEKQAQWKEDRLKQEITDLLTVFFRRKETKGTIACALRPTESTEDKSLEVLRLDPEKGFRDGADSECVIPADFLGGCEATTTYELVLHRDGDQMSEVFRKAGLDRVHADGQPQGFYYRVPAVVTACLKEKKASASETAAEQDLIVAQLGIVAALPSQRTYQTKYRVTLDPETGALTSLHSSSESVDKSLITDTGSAISGFLEAEAKRKKAQAEATDELALLERERKILEEQQKIRDLKEMLGQDGQD